MVIALKISIAFALLVSLICCILNAVIGRHLSDPNFQRNRQLIKVHGYALIFFQVCAFSRFTTNQVEILDTPSMLALYIYLEVVCFAMLMHYGRNDYRKTDVLLSFNHILVFLIALFLYVTYVMGYVNVYFTWHDYYESYRNGNITFFTRAVIVISLLVMAIQFIHNIRSAQKAYDEEEGDEERQTAAYRILMSWLALATLFLIGQFIETMAYHLMVTVAIVAVDVYSTGHIIRIVHAESMGQVTSGMSEVHRVIRKWLGSKPFPLKESLTMDDILEATSLSHDELSQYIYDLQDMTFTAWVRDKRLEYCQWLLRTTDLSLSQIAYESGYGELAAMSKAFKKKYGAAPSSYRRGKKG